MSESHTTQQASRSSNWGRWGENDERGTLNFITAETIVDATRLVRTGRVYRLAVPITARYSSPMREGALHVSSLRKDPTASRRQVAIDVVAMHTHDFTHVDALAHVGYEDRLYNGVAADSVGYHGATRNSIDNIGAIAGRALLLDVARANGVEALKTGHVITYDDLEGVLKRQGMVARRGDILLIRTGWIVPYLQDRNVALAGWPGLGASAVEWLAEHEICAVGADNVAVEVMPFEDPNRSFIVHERFIRDLGGYLIEFLDLEDLARDRVYESFFVMAPLRLVGGLGSPVTPIAIA